MTVNSKNILAQQARQLLANDWNSCHVRMLGETDAVECQMEVIRCKWAVPFKETYLCNYPNAKMHVVSSQPDSK